MFIVVSFTIFVTGRLISNHFLIVNIDAKINTTLEQKYQEKIAKETDVNKLISQGVNLSRGNQIGNALINLNRATSLSADSRDAWLFLGYAELKNNQPKKAIECLNRAAELDPIDPRIFQLLALGYEQVNDTVAAKTATEKYNFLTKKP